jgi:hypothetical protein
MRAQEILKCQRNFEISAKFREISPLSQRNNERNLALSRRNKGQPQCELRAWCVVPPSQVSSILDIADTEVRKTGRSVAWRIALGNARHRPKQLATGLPPAGPPEARAEVLCRMHRRRNNGQNIRRR